MRLHHVINNKNGIIYVGDVVIDFKSNNQNLIINYVYVI